jgi:hypothetical protein
MMSSKSRTKSPSKSVEMEKKPMFDHRLINLNTPGELQFEQVRARSYMAKYKLQEEIEAKYEDQIKSLKRELEETKAQIPCASSSHSSSAKRFTATYSSNDYTTTNDNNLTNVTQFSHMLSTFHHGSSHDDDDDDEETRQRSSMGNNTLIRNTDGPGNCTSFFGGNDTKVIIFISQNFFMSQDKIKFNKSLIKCYTARTNLVKDNLKGMFNQTTDDDKVQESKFTLL